MAGLAATLALPSVAGASTSTPSGARAVKHHHKSYTANWTFKDRSQHRCVSYKVTGGVKWDTQVHEPSGAIEWSHQRLSPQPTFTAIVHAYSHGACTGPAVLHKITMAQHWSGYSCSFTPSFGLTAPWGVSFSFWPDCSNKNQANFGSTYGSNGIYIQYTNGVPPISFGDWGDVPPTKGPCYGVYVSSTNYISDNISNSYRSSRHEVCLPS